MPLTRYRAKTLLLAILVVGGFLRWVSLKWDEGYHLHPDERFISMVEEKLSLPESVSQYFDSSRSSLNPYNRGHGSFVYGTVPVFLAKGIGKILGMRGYDGTYLVGRAVSGLFDLISVWIVYLLTRRVAPWSGRSTALAAAGLLAFCPLAIQLSHFWTSDTFLTTFSILALLGAVRLALGRFGIWGDVATGVAVGLAVSCKVTGLALLFPVGIAVLVRALRPRFEPAALPLPLRLAKATGQFFLVAAAAAMTIRVALPYAFLGPSPLSFRLDPRWIDDLKRLVALSGSVAGYPPALQWAGRTVLFPLYNFVFWAGGPFFGIAALVGLAWTCYAILRKRDWVLAPLLAHAGFLIAYHAAGLGKTLRYFYPVYPVLAVLTAAALTSLGRALAQTRPRRLARLANAVVLFGTLLCGAAFSAIYFRPHTRVEASRWIHAHVPRPSHFANETWDDALPFSIPGSDSSSYAGPMLDLWGPDNEEKVRHIVGTLEKADWIAITSNRVYANITRLPMVYPMTIAYYRTLFEGRLGFEQAAEFTSYPSLGPLRIPDDRSEEQFTVYDHPRVLLFRKTKEFSAERATKILRAAMPETPPTIWDWEKMPRFRRSVGSSLLPQRGADVEKEAAGMPGPEEMASFVAAVIWYLAIAAVGVLSLPLAHRIFPQLADRGYGLARILGLTVTTYVLTISVQSRLLPNGRAAAFLSLAVLAAASAALGWTRREEIRGFLRANAKPLLIGELVFAAGYVLFLGIRALNPEITWGEKPMDFSILNILVRTRTLPASDPWFAGAPLSYYTFGQAMIALLTLATGLSTRYTFNLAFGLLGGLTLQGAFSVARSWGGSLRTGFAGAALTAIAGNLAGLREWLVNKRKLDWDYFWATSRVVPHTINEYPIWSLTFADLHAHVLAMPAILLLFGCALQFVRTYSDPGSSWKRRILHAAPLGASAAAVALTNAWDVPFLVGLLPLVAAAAAWSGRRLAAGSTGRAALGGAIALATAALGVMLVIVRSGAMPGFGRNLDEGRGIDVLLAFGLFFFLAFMAGLSWINERMALSGMARPARWGILLAASLLLLFLGIRAVDAFLLTGILFFLFAAVRAAERPEERLAFGFVAAAFFLVLFCQRFYIIDRMNTFFKLYFEAWLLLAIATAALVFGGRDRGVQFRRWPLPARAAFFAVAAASLFTSVTAVNGALHHHFAAYSGPSLDGLRYLEESRPGEYLALNWMRRTIRGTPVTLEAQGESYQDFGRVSMFTGLPTVLGWDYHVKQRGNPDNEIEARKKVVEQIYSSPTIGPVESLLRRYHVGYVYVGWLERKTYPSAGLKKFDTAKGLLDLAYENRESKVYRVVGGETQDVMIVTRETLPVSTKPEATTDEPEEPPTFSETAEPDRPPYFGMRQPHGAAVDSKGRLWVADLGNNRIRLFDVEGGYLGGFGGRGNGTYGLREPNTVAIDGDDLYVADTWNGRVEHFSLEGEAKSTVTGLYGPRGVAASPGTGPVWVTDTGNNRIVRYTRDLTEPRIVGEKGSQPGKFLGPVGIAVGSSGSVFVADVGNRRVQVLDREGTPVTVIAVPGWPEWCQAYVYVDRDENVYVSDPVKNNVLQFDRRGTLVRTWTADDSGQAFSMPTGVAVDSRRGLLYVINSAGNQAVAKCRIPVRK